jgi:hypothetical protein
VETQFGALRESSYASLPSEILDEHARLVMRTHLISRQRAILAVVALVTCMANSGCSVVHCCEHSDREVVDQLPRRNDDHDVRHFDEPLQPGDSFAPDHSHYHAESPPGKRRELRLDSRHEFGEWTRAGGRQQESDRLLLRHRQRKLQGSSVPLNSTGPAMNGNLGSVLFAPSGQAGFYVDGIRYENQQEFIDDGGRCGTRKPSPEEWSENIQILEELDQELKADGSFRRRLQSSPIVVRVNYVIISNTSGSGYVLDEQLQAQTNVLNNAFWPHFTFQPYNVLRVVHDLFHSNCRMYGRQFKKLYRQGGPETLNFYTCNGAGVLGFANLPYNGGNTSTNDGVVVSHTTLPGRSSGRYKLGFVSAGMFCGSRVSFN